MVVAKRVLTLGAAGVALGVTAAALASGYRHYGGEAVIAIVETPRTADPLEAQTGVERMLSSLVHCSLFRADAHGRVSPLLVDASFEPPRDGRSYVLTVDPQARFSNGDAITGADVADSLLRLAVSDSGWMLSGVAGYDAVASGEADELSGVRVLDERRVVIRTSRAFYGLEHLLAAPQAAITKRGGGVDPFWGPPGAGPFAPGATGNKPFATLQPSTQFVHGRPFVNQLTFERAADDHTAASWLSRGRADAAFVSQADSRSTPTPATVVLLVGNDIATGERERIQQSIDRKVLTEVFLRGKARAASGLLPPLVLPSTRSVPKVDRRKLDKSRRRTLWVPDQPSELTVVAERLAVDLLSTGLLIERKTASLADLRKRAASGDYDLMLLEWRPAALDPALATWEWSVNPALAPAATSVASELEALPGMADADARLAEARRLEGALLDSGRIVPLYHPTHQLEVGARLRGIAMEPRGWPAWADAWLTPEGAQ